MFPFASMGNVIDASFVNIITSVVTPIHHWQSTGLTKTDERKTNERQQQCVTVFFSVLAALVLQKR